MNYLHHYLAEHPWLSIVLSHCYSICHYWPLFTAIVLVGHWPRLINPYSVRSLIDGWMLLTIICHSKTWLTGLLLLLLLLLLPLCFVVVDGGDEVVATDVQSLSHPLGICNELQTKSAAWSCRPDCSGRMIGSGSVMVIWAPHMFLLSTWCVEIAFAAILCNSFPQTRRWKIFLQCHNRSSISKLRKDHLWLDMGCLTPLSNKSRSRESPSSGCWPFSGSSKLPWSWCLPFLISETFRRRIHLTVFQGDPLASWATRFYPETCGYPRAVFANFGLHGCSWLLLLRDNSHPSLSTIMNSSHHTSIICDS